MFWLLRQAGDGGLLAHAIGVARSGHPVAGGAPLGGAMTGDLEAETASSLHPNLPSRRGSRLSPGWKIGLGG
jgi:hypothetical protein